MKRLLVVLLCLVLFTAATAAPTLACHRRYAYRRAQAVRYYNPRRAYYGYSARRRSFWQRHRDALTLAIGTGGGAAVGGLLGGRRGAGIGALVGLGSSALYTYKLRNRHRRY